MSTRSPTAGTRPRCVSRKPPTVSNPSRSIWTPSRCVTSSMSTLPLNTNRPPPSSTIGSDSTSYSSRISPTISSSRSSIVTRPAVPPYSSTTIAICVCCRWNCFSSSGTRLLSGTMTAGRSSVVIGRESSAVFSATRSFTKTKPAMLSRLSLKTGKPRVLLLAEQRAQIADGRRPRGSRRCRDAASSPRAPACRRSRRCSGAAGAPRLRSGLPARRCSRYAFVASLASSAASSGVGRGAGPLRGHRPAPSSARTGRSALAIGLKDGSRTSSTRSGSRADDEQRQQQLDDDDEARRR